MAFLDMIIPILPTCGLLLGVLALGVAFSYLLLNLTYRRILTCPECGEKSAGEHFDTEELQLSSHIDHRGRKAVRVKKVKITDHYRCKQCEHTWSRSFERTDRIQLDKENHR